MPLILTGLQALSHTFLYCLLPQIQPVFYCRLVNEVAFLSHSTSAVNVCVWLLLNEPVCWTLHSVRWHQYLRKLSAPMLGWFSPESLRSEDAHKSSFFSSSSEDVWIRKKKLLLLEESVLSLKNRAIFVKIYHVSHGGTPPSAQLLLKKMQKQLDLWKC